MPTGPRLKVFLLDVSLAELAEDFRAAPSLELATLEQVLSAPQPVVLFVDTFSGYLDSEVAIAALRVLRSAGYTVHAARGERVLALD